MDLGQDVEVLVLIHGGLVCLIDENVVLFAHFLDLGLHHPVVVIQPIVCVLGLADGQLQLLLYLFLHQFRRTFEVMFSFRACSLASSSSSSSSSSS